MIYDCIVIGAGASGLYAAAHLELNRVMILEKKQRPGLKLGVSGSGQCNLTHDGYMNHFLTCYGQRKAYVKSALKKHDNRAVRAFFKANGVDTVVREDGKVFPASFKARDVIEALVHTIEGKGYEIRLNTSVLALKPQGKSYQVETTQGAFLTQTVILATGGKSYPELGTEGDGYTLASQLGLEVTALKPGLTGVVLKAKVFSELSGLSFPNATVVNQRTQKTYRGDLLMTHVGLSGPVIINNSRDFSGQDILRINWQSRNQAEFQVMLNTVITKEGSKSLAYALNQIGLPERFKRFLALALKLDVDKRLAELTRSERLALEQAVLAYPVTIQSLQGFESAMVTVGGVACDGVDTKTFEAQSRKGLFVVGELLDVDGDTGGYNLQWAFSSGYCAARAINKSLQTPDVDKL